VQTRAAALVQPRKRRDSKGCYFQSDRNNALVQDDNRNRLRCIGDSRSGSRTAGGRQLFGVGCLSRRYCIVRHLPRLLLQSEGRTQEPDLRSGLLLRPAGGGIGRLARLRLRSGRAAPADMRTVRD
jgi:hypothetical protein